MSARAAGAIGFLLWVFVILSNDGLANAVVPGESIVRQEAQVDVRATVETALPLDEFERGAFPWRDIQWVVAIRMIAGGARHAELLTVRSRSGSDYDAELVELAGTNVLEQLEVVRKKLPTAGIAELSERLPRTRYSAQSSKCPALLRLARSLEKLRFPLVPSVHVALGFDNYDLLVQDAFGVRTKAFVLAAEEDSPNETEEFLRWWQECRQVLRTCGKREESARPDDDGGSADRP